MMRRHRSPAKRSRDRSPAKRSRDRSPAKRSRDRSPARRSRNRSPAKRSRDRSSAKRSRDRSPAKRSRDRSPTKRSRARSFSLSSISSDDKNDNQSRKRKSATDSGRNRYGGRDKKYQSRTREHDCSNSKSTQPCNDRSSEKHLKIHKENEVEENYLNILENADPKASEECKDPSICNFQVTFEDNKFEPIAEKQTSSLYKKIFGDSKPKEKSDSENKSNSTMIQEKNSEDRLNQLEKLVEMLMNNKSQKTNKFSEQSTINVDELNPRNTALTTSMWLSKVNDECLQLNLGDRASIEYMQSKMSGIIKAWFKTLELTQLTFFELKMLLTRTFPDNVDFAQTLRLLVERMKQPEETITHYYFSKMYLLEACKISSMNAVSCIIDGLIDPIWQEEARAGMYSNPEILYSEFLSQLPNNGLESVVVTQMQPIETLVTMNNHPTDVNICTQDKSDGNSTGSNVKYKLKKGCYVCGKQGHRSFQCKLAPVCLTCGKPDHLTIKCRHAQVCYKCDKKGHIAANCKVVAKK